MATYNVTLTDAEIRAMEHVCVDVQEWVETAFRHRILTAMTGLSDLEMAKAIKNGTDIITDRELLVKLSNEPAMVEWLPEDQYQPNPDNPFVNPIVKLSD